MHAIKWALSLMAVLVLMTGTAQATVSGVWYSSYSTGAPVRDTDSVLIDRVIDASHHSNVRIPFPDIATYASGHVSGTPNAFAAYSSAGLLTSLPTDCSLTTIGGSAAISTCPDIPLTSTITSAACGRILPYTLPAPISVTMPSASSPGMTQGCEFSIYATATAGPISLTSNGSTIASLNPFPVPSGTGCWLRSDGSNWKANLAACSALTNNLARIAPVGTAGQIFFNSGGTQISALTIGGDAVLYTSSGALTLNTVNATTGTFGSSSSISTFTVNGKGQITFASSAPLAAPNPTVNARTGSYTFTLADTGAYAAFSSSSNLTATIPPHSSVAFSNGAQLPFAMWGGGTMTVLPGAGVALRYASGLTFTSAAGYAIQTGQDNWDVIGGK